MATGAEHQVTASLGELVERADRHMRSGRYATVGEVLREGLNALDREEAAFDAMLKAKVEEAIADPRPSISIDEAFESIWARIDARRAADGV